jgi:hypothetical protein
MTSNVASLVGAQIAPSAQVTVQPKINYLAVVVAAVAAFVASGLWYSPVLFGTLYAQVRGAAPGAMAPGEIGIELLRTLVVAYVFAQLVKLLGVRDWQRGLRLGLLVWIGFPTMILLGSVAHENVPLALAAIHSGDWLVKVLILAVVPSVWRRRPGPGRTL